MATFFSGLLVGVAVGLAQLDHLEKIQQEGHLKYEHDHLDFAWKMVRFHPARWASSSTRLNNRVRPLCQIWNSHFRQIHRENKCKTWKFQRRRNAPRRWALLPDSRLSHSRQIQRINIRLEKTHPIVGLFWPNSRFSHFWQIQRKDKYKTWKNAPRRWVRPRTLWGSCERRGASPSSASEAAGTPASIKFQNG